MKKVCERTIVSEEFPDGHNFGVFVKKPTHRDLSDAQLYASTVFRKAKDAGAILRVELDSYLREQGLWDDKKAAEVKKIVEEINKITTELEKGKLGEYKTRSQARKAAIDVRILRAKQHRLLAETTRLDAYTVEGQSDNARFDYLVSKCVVNEDGTPVFESVDDYYDNAEEDWAAQAAEEVSYALHPELDRDWEKNLPENKLLLKYGFVNEDLSLVDKDGNLVDRDFNRLDEEVKQEFEEFDDDMS